MVSKSFLMISLLVSFNTAEKSPLQEESRQFATSKTNGQEYLNEAFSNYYYARDEPSQQQYDSDLYTNQINEDTYKYDSEVEPLGSDKIGSHNSPALSALALLGFMYFLNLIQTVLQNSSGRKRRHAQLEEEYVGDISLQLQTMEKFIQTLQGIFPETTGGDSQPRCYSCGNSEQERASRIVNNISHFWDRIRSFLGLSSSVSRADPPVPPGKLQSNSPGMWSAFGENIHRISAIMDFLSDPQPSRIHRSYETYSYPEESQQVPEDQDSSPAPRPFHQRTKRYTDTMNSWYDKAGHNTNTDQINGPALIMNAFLSLMKNSGQSGR